MKKLRLIITLLIAFLFLEQCSTDFDLNAPYKDIMVVYGLLNQNDSTHYLKINRAFLGEDDALIMA
ncbi:MAG: hypothetical protein IH594_01340, partial [Bacteroidales bacterium]|nr:hypothetical protein [Bacteroidales bacterium]